MNKKISLIMASTVATILIAYISALSNQAFAVDQPNQPAALFRLHLTPFEHA